MAESCKDLPDECWELILARLHQLHHSHLESPSLSCKRLLSIANSLRTHLKILHPTAIPLSTLFNRFPNLNYISIFSLRDFDEQDLNHIVTHLSASNLNLETLDFSGAKSLHLESLKILGSRMKSLRVLKFPFFSILRDIDLLVIADSMPSLEELDISHSSSYFGFDTDELQAIDNPGAVGVTDSGIQMLSSKLEGLRKIDISGHVFLTDKSLLALSTNCVYLTDIWFCGCSLVTLYGIEFVIRNSTNLSVLSMAEIDFGRFNDYSIRCARNISSLEIYNSTVPDEYLHLLVKAGIPLKKFTLSHCERFTFSGISSLSNIYRSLVFLCLRGISFLTDEKMSDLSQCLSALVTIHLDLCKSLTETAFFNLVKYCPLLEDVSMNWTNLGGGDRATYIVKSSRIKSVNLENNPKMSDECLANVASLCPSLEVLVVSSCKSVTEKGIADFFKSGSKIRELQIYECGGIKSIGNGSELSELHFLGAARSGLNDDGLAVLGKRCRGLLHLSLENCLGVTTMGLKEILTNCKRLGQLDLTGCLNASTETVDWMVFSRPSLRKIIVSGSSLPSESQRKLFLRHGCLVFSKELP